MDTSLAMAAGAPSTEASRVWINGPRWDVGWLIGTALVVPIVLLFVWYGASSDFINLGVTAIIGGPHLFATYTVTYMDPRFRKSHWWLLLAATIVVPSFVVFMTLWNFQILLSVFIFSASVHVLHQNAYLTDIYRRRAGEPEAMWSRLIDYGLLMVCIYPIATYKLVHGNFLLGDVEILIPEMFKVPATYWFVWVVFAGFLSAWIVKTWSEYKRGVLNNAKTLLIAVTTVIAFWVPAAAEGERLELAFQAVNAWHAIQYMGVLWYIQKVRKDRGLIGSSLIQKISGGGRSGWYFYGFCLAITLTMFGILVTAAKNDIFGFSAKNGADLGFQQYYYMGVLSCLLIHYVFDGYLFAASARTSNTLEYMPYMAPSER
ncbi:MAG: hypothetical protein KC416_07275 [Myxococcales bacterium]|nr:hypothetical protein [Myxococcales bacterium]